MRSFFAWCGLVFLVPLWLSACSSGETSNTEAGDGDGMSPGSGGGLGTGGAASGGSVGETGGAASGGGGALTGGASPGVGGEASGGESSASGGFVGDPCAGLLLCDDFEADTLDFGLWFVEATAENTIELTSDFAAFGQQSVHLHVVTGFARLKNESVFPMPNNDYFGRMYLRVAQFSTVDYAHWTVGEGAGTGDNALIRVGGQYLPGQQNYWGVGTDLGATGDWTRHDADPSGSPSEPPENEWTCIEWEHKGSTNETRFFIEGVQHPSLDTSADDHGGSGGQYILPEFTSFWFGWWQYQEDPSLEFDVWMDLIALDDERIGCL